MSAYRLSVNVRYLDGPLQGIDISRGYSVVYPTRNRAERVAFAIACTEPAPIMAAVLTGHHYIFTSEPVIEEVEP